MLDTESGELVERRLHVAQNQRGRKSAVDHRTTRHRGYGISQKARKKVEEIFGWMKTIGLSEKLRHRGLERVGWMLTLTAAAYNLVRIGNLARAAPVGATANTPPRTDARCDAIGEDGKSNACSLGFTTFVAWKRANWQKSRSPQPGRRSLLPGSVAAGLGILQARNSRHAGRSMPPLHC